MNTYKVLVVGMGKRGMHHATAFCANTRFELAGICDIDAAKLAAAAPKLGHPRTDTDATRLAHAVRPDVFCFCTLPNLRLDLVKLGVDSGAKMIAFEKPVAMTSAEGLQIKRVLDATRVKVVVSHQHRYGEHYRKVKEIIDSGALGRVHTVYGTATGWAAHMLSHLIDYTSWFNNYTDAAWAMAQAAGRASWPTCITRPITSQVSSTFRTAYAVSTIVAPARPMSGGALLVAQMPHWRTRH